MAGDLMARKAIPLLVNGSLDTKLNPKLVQPPALLELENMYQLRTGEMRVRNGFTALTATNNPLNAGTNLFATKTGGLATIGSGGVASDVNVRALRYGNAVSGRVGWAGNTGDQVSASVVQQSYPNVVASIVGLPTGSIPAGAGSAIVTVTDPDMAIIGGAEHAAWTNGTDAKILSDLRDPIDHRALSTAANLQPTTAALRPPLVASTGGNWGALFYSSAANTLNAVAHNPVSGTTTSLALAVDLAASPWFDAKAIPGTNNFAVAYKANGGGVTCGIYNPSASTFTSTVNTAAADASFCLGWLDDRFAIGSMFLATAGSGSGVVVREMSATNMVVSATRTIDAGATANIRNITGHLYASTPRYVVFWDVSGASTILDGTKFGSWNGAAATAGVFTGGPHTLYSRSVFFPDGKYRLLGCFFSPVQPMYTLFLCDQGGTSPVPNGVSPQCHVLSGEAAARRSQCSLTSPVVTSTGVQMIVARARSIATPAGVPATPLKTASVVTFSVMTAITHAREVGNTVFIPGGLLHRDDGVTIEPATFPIYPEVPTGVSSNLGGAMTASGTYSYRIVFRAADADGRTTRSAGSTVFTITLGAGDNRVTLTIWGLSLNRGDVATAGMPGYGRVMAEVYRKGPAASGATLYNKVGEVLAETSPAVPTVTFIDGVSDANAAAGEAAYFNGNVLENFHPPSHSLLEVNGNRVGLVNAEDPTEFWPSKEYKAGTGIGFNPLLKVAITGDGAGGMTALASMDGNWILFKKTAIYVLSGDGPNDLGQGSFNAPRAVSRSIGTSNPSSVIETPDGIMFQSTNGGIWLLGRGFDLSYVGAPVENDTSVVSSTIVVAGAALTSTLPTVRFVMSGTSGLILEWDYFHKRWYRHLIRTNDNAVVDCANSPLFGWCVMLSDGSVLQEVAFSTADVYSGTAGIAPKVTFPEIQLSGLAGYQRFHAIEYTLDVTGNHTLVLTAAFNLSASYVTPKTIALTTGATPIQIEYNPPEGFSKCTAIRPQITVAGPPTTGSFRLTGATAYVTVKRGTDVSAGNRAT